jgi:hypothetical protein
VLLRKIDKRRWDVDLTRPSWLPTGDFPASPLADLNTSYDSNLSVWFIEKEANVKEIVVAMASTRDHVDKFDYALFPESIVNDANIGIHTSPANTPHVVANQWHRDLLELSSSKLVNLARLISERGSFYRVKEKDVKEWLEQAIEKRSIDPEKMNKKLKEVIRVE